jgi:hypothetical protein
LEEDEEEDEEEEEHFRVSNLINHVTLRIKVKKNYSE